MRAAVFALRFICSTKVRLLPLIRHFPPSLPSVQSPLYRPPLLRFYSSTAITRDRYGDNMFDIFKLEIARGLSAISGVDQDTLFNALDAPKVAAHGDLAIAVPRLRLKGNPVALAKEWVEKFEPNEYVLKASCIGPFINFSISHTHLCKLVLTEVFERKENFGTNTTHKGKRAIVEFSSPNIAKPFHAGHLRSTIIGNFVRNVLQANGWETIAMNYLGDWGKQYGLLAIGFERYGSKEALQADPIHHLYEVYVQVNKAAEQDPAIHDDARAYFKKMEDGDQDALQLWQEFRDMSIVKYKETYTRLNINFDVYSGESQVTYGMQRALESLDEKGLIKESEGARIIDLDEKYKLGKAVLQKKDGTTLYLTRDIGAAMERWDKYHFDAIYYIIGSQQDQHVKQLFKILHLLDLPYADRFHHINFGLVSGMSTRKGTAVFLQDMLEQTKERMHEVMRANEEKYAQIDDPEHVADIIGMSAITVQDMAARRIRNYDFDWQRMFSFEGDTGPYLQYAHARLFSVERNAEMPVELDVDLSLLQEPAAQQIVEHIAKYPALVASLPANFEPVNVITYALKLSHLVSSAYESLRVRGAPREVGQARLLLYWAARMTLGNALRLVGLVPLERM
ncbi:arginyl-tRNA synthetase [Dispira parvispora]|uniref:arginine--tRNA ligase n=1 Tax=Dispira parvispora TaxID=1520584 RepID=A0A9W8E5G5_9FUNG|nr:arginyl-tRNA synthetase [Dispira parvispora]